ncbi:hypothetical protein [Radiobacillus deserti]|uniref:hypothetical protein n=1 Tax=Radiobacillus deserti TaxID=2594883 RepID=UPI001E5183EF|nr:hypothetical protein [Radiobacillus deserti]
MGHVGIVGQDMLIHHSHPLGAFSETLSRYKSRHKFGGEILLLRPKTAANEAANWAQANIPYVKRYLFDPRLKGVSNNYCSKFIWQAFWNGAGLDLTNHHLTSNRISWVYPYQIKRSTYLQTKDSIIVPPALTHL